MHEFILYPGRGRVVIKNQKWKIPLYLFLPFPYFYEFLAFSKLFFRNFPEDETGLNILNAAKEILSEFKILQKVWIILTDNGSNIKLATRLLREEQNSELNDAEEPDWSKIEEQIDEGILINDNDNVQERDGKWNLRK